MRRQNKLIDECSENRLLVKWLGRQNYLSIWKAMQEFTNHRNEQTLDEIWLLEHEPVFTQGQNGKAEHLLNSGDIPCVQSDRGGQITYHGPGQLMVYTLIDIRRKKLNVRELVTNLEQTIIDYLSQYQITAKAKCEAPGVYINEDKICSVGLRIRRGCAYHGIAFNIAMDLAPFAQINPCGFKTLKMTQLANYIEPKEPQQIGYQLIEFLQKNLGYTSVSSDKVVS